MSSISPLRNNLLARLPTAQLRELESLLRPVTLEFKQVIYRQRDAIEKVYFPTSGALSAMTIMENGSAIEVATVGNEGMLGLSILLAGPRSPNEVIVQVAGEGLQMDAADFERLASCDGTFRQLMQRYGAAYLTQVSQSVACNGLHAVQQRCCSWLLITLDRMDSNVVPLTHEFLAIMLGVRRATVTEVLRPLQDQKLISNLRGKIMIDDRAGLERLSCECYRTVKDEFDRVLG